MNDHKVTEAVAAAQRSIDDALEVLEKTVGRPVESLRLDWVNITLMTDHEPRFARVVQVVLQKQKPPKIAGLDEWLAGKAAASALAREKIAASDPRLLQETGTAISPIGLMSTLPPPPPKSLA